MGMPERTDLSSYVLHATRVTVARMRREHLRPDDLSDYDRKMHARVYALASNGQIAFVESRIATEADIRHYSTDA